VAVQELQERVAKLEKTSIEVPSWLEGWNVKGDFRYRHEFVDDGPKDYHRHRIRARIFAGVEVNDQVDFGFQLATGGANPTSSNVTLGRGWERADVGVDLAYVDWHPCQQDEDGLSFGAIGGKTKVPFDVMSKSELVWDGDLRTEGIAARYENQLGATDVHFVLGGFWLDNDSSGADPGLFGGQLGASIPLSDDRSLDVGIGHYSYVHLEGNSLFDFGKTAGRGNTTVGAPGSEVYANDYALTEIYAQYSTELSEQPFAVFANGVQNSEADDEDTGWVAGCKLGKAKQPGTWDFRLQYKEVEADAVLSAFTDSDFGGGGTDNEGFEFNANYAFMQSWVIGFSYFDNTTNVASGDEDDYQRVQLDLKWKF